MIPLKNGKSLNNKMKDNIQYLIKILILIIIIIIIIITILLIEFEERIKYFYEQFKFL